MKPFNLKEYIKNPNRKVITRNGRPVKIVYTDKKGMYPVVALIEYNNTYENVFAFTTDGRYSFVETDEKDLFFMPEKKVCWANIYRGKDEPVIGHIFNSEEEARESSRHCNNYTKDLYLGTAKIEWEEE